MDEVREIKNRIFYELRLPDPESMTRADVDNSDIFGSLRECALSDLIPSQRISCLCEFGLVNRSETAVKVRHVYEFLSRRQDI
jgi:hypothetical protein